MGRLLGIARRKASRAPMEILPHAAVRVESGVEGDFRGRVRPGRKPRRQVSLIEADSWQAAIQDLGLPLQNAPQWYHRRANFLVGGIRLPREPGAILAIGPDLRLEITMECDPCDRMDEIVPGLQAALLPDWRGGVLATVLSDGEIAVGDEIRIEQ